MCAVEDWLVHCIRRGGGREEVTPEATVRLLLQSSSVQAADDDDTTLFWRSGGERACKRVRSVGATERFPLLYLLTSTVVRST